MLHLHRAERADGLVTALADLLASPLDDPMQPEVISVPTRGVERWLTQQLSGHLGATAARSDGVCANIDFPFPGRLVGGAVAAASGVDRLRDPWLAERAVWPLLDVVDECLAEPWLWSLAAHLGATGTGPEADRRGRRFGSVRHIADLFDSYGVARPDMVCAWAGATPADRTGHALPPDAAWQAELWRHLRARIAVPSPAERLTPACARLRAEPALADGLPGSRLDLRPHPPARQLSASSPCPGGRTRCPPVPASPLAGAVGPHQRRRSGRSRSPAPRR